MSRRENALKIETHAARLAPYAFTILRIMAALLFMQHGMSKLLAFPMAMNSPALFSLYWFAAVIEVVGGALVAVGLFTRPAAFIMSGEMAFAYFMSHAPKGFYPILNGGEAAILFCFVFLYIAAAGAGAFSLDSVWQARRSGARTAFATR
jgi:putative oxidoreductase